MGLFLVPGALFELAVGAKFILDPAALHGGYEPAQGFERYAFEIFGFACVFWGLMTLCKKDDKAIAAFNVMWSVFWALHLGAAHTGHPWRPESSVPDAAWAIVPVIAHTVCVESVRYLPT